MAANLATVDRRDHVIRVEAWIVAGPHEEAGQNEQPQVVRRPAVDKDGLVAQPEPVGAHMANRAVEPDTLDPGDDSARHTDRQLRFRRLVEHPESSVTRRPDLVAEHD